MKRQFAITFIFCLFYILANHILYAQEATLQDVEVVKWAAILREYPHPDPGPIDSRTAALKRQILNAPLEQLPPEIRTGVALCQLKIYQWDGNWDGVLALKDRILDNPEWKRSNLDVYPLGQIVGYYTSVGFPPPGGPSQGVPLNQYREMVMSWWDANIKDSRKATELLERMSKEIDYNFLRGASHYYYLVGKKVQMGFGDKEEIKKMFEDHEIPDYEDLYALSYYDLWGRLNDPEDDLRRSEWAVGNLLRNAHEWRDWANGVPGARPVPIHWRPDTTSQQQTSDAPTSPTMIQPSHPQNVFAAPGQPSTFNVLENQPETNAAVTQASPRIKSPIIIIVAFILILAAAGGIIHISKKAKARG